MDRYDQGRRAQPHGDELKAAVTQTGITTRKGGLVISIRPIFPSATWS